jgi:hypothetical protein
MLLATIIAFGVPNTHSATLNATEDGISLSGMFFSKLETMRSKLISGGTGNVRSQALLQSKCMTLICKDTAVQFQVTVYVVDMTNKILFGRSKPAEIHHAKLIYSTDE